MTSNATDVNDLLRFFLKKPLKLNLRPRLDGHVLLVHKELERLNTSLVADRADLTVDALLSIAYVAMAGVYEMGLDWDAHWQELHKERMAKTENPKGVELDVFEVLSVRNDGKIHRDLIKRVLLRK